VVVYGGSSAGVISAVQAAKMGREVLLLEPGRHLGGLTSGGLGATDFGKSESIGGLAREFYRRVKAHYEQPTSWVHQKREEFQSHGHDSRQDVMWYFEPHVAERIFAEMAGQSGVQARIALEAIKRLITVEQIAAEKCLYSVKVTQWKSQMIEFGLGHLCPRLVPGAARRVGRGGKRAA
jgi:glycine/D-amino acid oxidase-like deaminating enzyme